jgi:anti-sigma B factor antagonist
MTQPKITLTVRPATLQSPTITVIDIQGEMTAAADAPLTEAYNRASGAKTVILNFSALEYMNSSGIGVLVTLLIRAQRQGQKLMAFGLSEHYREIFELTRLNEAILLFDDEQSAVAALNGTHV